MSCRAKNIASATRAVAILLLAFLASSLHAQINIVTQPQAVTVQAGQQATFSVVATGAGAVSYQWRRSGYALPGATAASYTIAAVSQGHIDNYDVVVRAGTASITSQVARLWVTLPSYPAGVEVDLARSFRLEGPRTGAIAVHAALPDGRYYVTGNFTSIGGYAVRTLARLNANGTPDRSFIPPVFDGLPTTLAIQPDGKILLAGYFKQVDGFPAAGMVRLNSDGSRDAAFSVGAGFITVPDRILVTSSGIIYAASSSRLRLAQVFDEPYVVKLLPSGARDVSYPTPFYTSNVSGGGPTRFALGPTGLLYVSGDFIAIDGTPRVRVARFLPDGKLDPAFDPGAGPNASVYALAALGNGQIALGGSFTAYNGTAVGHIARVNANGAIDSTFATGSGFVGDVLRLAELPGNSLLVGPTGGQYKAVSTSTFVWLSASGELVAMVPDLVNLPDRLVVLPNGQFIASGAYLDGEPGEIVRVYSAAGGALSALSPRPLFAARARWLANDTAGRVLVAGDFTEAGGVPAPYVMRLNADLSRDVSFPAGPGPRHAVMAGTVQPDGKILVSTSQGRERLNADGSTDVTFTLSGPSTGEFSLPPVALGDGRFLFSTGNWSGVPLANGFAIMEPSGARTAVHPLLANAPTSVVFADVQMAPSGQLVFLGTFSTWGGLARAKLARVNPDGSVDPVFVPEAALPLPQFPRPPLAGGSFQRDGRYLVVTDAAEPAVIRLNANGTRDTAFAGALPGAFFSGRMLVQPDERVMVSAQARPIADGTRPPVFFRLTRDGASDATLAIRGSGPWQCAILTDRGDLLSSDDTGYLHRYRAIVGPVITTQPLAQTVFSGASATFTVAASGPGPFSVQWQRDGVALVGATNATLFLDRVLAAAGGSYTAVVTGPGGSATSAPAVLSVAPRPVPGVYVGTLGVGQGTFSLRVGPGGTGEMLAYLRTRRAVLIAREIAVAVNRSVRGSFSAVTSIGIETPSPFECTISADGELSGQIAGLAATATVPPTFGGPAGVAGFYLGGVAGTATSVFALIGESGSAYVAIFGGGVADACATTLNTAGQINTTTENNARLTVVPRAASATLIGNYTPPGNAAAPFGAGNNESRASIEALVNVSARCRVGGAAGALTAGFVVAGDAPKMTLVRGVGPTLAAFGLGEALPAARLQLTRDGSVFSTGLDWGAAPNAGAIAAAAARLGAFALPLTSRDAALLGQVQPGAYTAVVTGQSNAEGVALIEVYDATDGPVPRGVRITNLSTLSNAGVGENALLAGFSITGLVPKRLLIRGAGPALAAFGVVGALARPQLAVYSGNRILMQNAGWSASPDNMAIAQAAAGVGAFAFADGGADAALLIYLSPGTYSAQVSGLNGATGAALVEIYDAP